jgi:hypothetical protein
VPTAASNARGQHLCGRLKVVLVVVAVFGTSDRHYRMESGSVTKRTVEEMHLRRV